MKRSLILGVWLVAAWIALWQELSFANVASGVVVAAVLLVLFPLGGRRPHRPIGATHLRPWAALRFAAFFAGKLVEANAVVAWQVLRPATGVVEGIVAVPLHTTSKGMATIVADAVTLTPGTMTLDIDRPPPGDGPIVLFIHVLRLGDPEAVRADVRHFEALAVAAFGDRAELATEADS